ncbi:MAG TPA: hypothetical protein VKY65_07905 [Alphaproteobacteria bacterium]|nr:hypothetical protein [Alphaproteobacteria bacterium]
MAALDRLVKDAHDRLRTLLHYPVKIAMHGGYLARANDPSLGNATIWHGLSRPIDIALDVTLQAQLWVIERAGTASPHNIGAIGEPERAQWLP